MIKFFFAFLFLSAGCACMAQDRIHTKDGRVIECKVSDSSNRAGNVFFFPADDPETSHFIPVTQVDYLEIGDERVVRTPNDKLKPAETRFGLKAPALPHMLGATYDFLSNTYVHTHGATVSYAYFFDGRNGIHAELAYRSLESASASERRADPGTSVDIFAVIPHYERRFYIQRMGSFYIRARRFGRECLYGFDSDGCRGEPRRLGGSGRQSRLGTRFPGVPQPLSGGCRAVYR